MVDSKNFSLLSFPKKSKSATSSSTCELEYNLPEPTIIKRRNSSFASTSSPWFRRNSFLSSAMIQNENFSVYDAPNYYSDSSSYSIISLKECQGFIFNQDLFASPYQQSRSLANERKFRALSFSKSRSRSRSQSKSKSKSATPSGSNNCSSISLPIIQNQRRHTSYHESRPSFLASGSDNDTAIDDDNDDINEDVSSHDSIITDEDDHAIVDEYDEYEEMNDYGGDSTNRVYKVHVTEIIVNENDNSIFPN